MLDKSQGIIYIKHLTEATDTYMTPIISSQLCLLNTSSLLARSHDFSSYVSSAKLVCHFLHNGYGMKSTNCITKKNQTVTREPLKNVTLEDAAEAQTFSKSVAFICLMSIIYCKQLE